MCQSGSFLRRCHVCGATIEKVSRSIGQCLHCGKHIAPFYYFDERQIIGFGDNNGVRVRPGEADTTYQPLIGFGLYWEVGEDPLTIKQ